jgi:hypothetical protein
MLTNSYYHPGTQFVVLLAVRRWWGVILALASLHIRGIPHAASLMALSFGLGG